MSSSVFAEVVLFGVRFYQHWTICVSKARARDSSFHAFAAHSACCARDSWSLSPASPVNLDFPCLLYLHIDTCAPCEAERFEDVDGFIPLTWTRVRFHCGGSTTLCKAGSLTATKAYAR